MELPVEVAVLGERPRRGGAVRPDRAQLELSALILPQQADARGWTSDAQAVCEVEKELRLDGLEMKRLEPDRAGPVQQCHTHGHRGAGGNAWRHAIAAHQRA